MSNAVALASAAGAADASATALLMQASILGTAMPNGAVMLTIFPAWSRKVKVRSPTSAFSRSFRPLTHIV